jgi:SAM-dependent methyltransferase
VAATMVTVREHYDDVLAPYYSRMFGDFETKVGEQQTLFERLATRAGHGDSMAVDLGCGSGFQSIALARLGFRVLAIDFSRRLLDELNERACGLSVTAVTGDIRDVAALAPSGVEVVACMGDTLSHLEHLEDLGRVFEGSASRLTAGGRLILTFRDLGGELRELDRFIPLCRSDDLIMTCFLEYEAMTVKVHDLIWVRQPGGWQFRKSVYRKLRLAPAVVIEHLEKAGFAVARHEAPAGMVALVGTLLGSSRS